MAKKKKGLSASTLITFTAPDSAQSKIQNETKKTKIIELMCTTSPTLKTKMVHNAEEKGW